MSEQRPTQLSAAKLQHHGRQTSCESETKSPDFRFSDSPTALSDTAEGQNRTGEWLSGLEMGVAPESPTDGLICQAPKTPDVSPVPESKTEPAAGIAEAMPQRRVEDDQESLSSGSPGDEPLTDGASDDILSSVELFGGNKTDVQDDKRRKENVAVFPQVPKLPTSGIPEKAYKATVERRWKRTAPALDADAISQSPRRSPSPRMYPFQDHLLTPERSISPRRSPPQFEGPSSFLMTELKTAAFLEYSVYLARPGEQHILLPLLFVIR